MAYLQLTEENTPLREIYHNDNIQWDETHFCPASALTEEERALFRIVPLIETPLPEYNIYTHKCLKGTAEFVDTHWVVKWDIIPYSEEDLALMLQTAKAQKLLLINSWRAQANQTSFMHNGKVIACDALSRSDIDGVAGHIALNGTFPDGFPGAWKATDNTYIILADIDAFKAMYNSMTAQGTLNFNRSQELKTVVNNATKIEDVIRVVW